MDDPTSAREPAPTSFATGAPGGGGAPPVTIAEHELLRCIGRGSYGEVWLARNMMGMYRAVKIVHRQTFDSDRPFQRELLGIRKFEPVSRSHEGFVDVLHVGINEDQGYFYYVMELGDDAITGQDIDPQHYTPRTLAKVISTQKRLPLPECLQLGLALSMALAELHKKGLVHRDVKPSNIIFVNGVPKLADIGLVAELNEARSYVGTEGFIPPEGPGTPQADVYGLGKVLYEMSTGRDRQDFPELPTQLERLAEDPGFLELNAVILQACKNEVKLRYQTAWDMHADLVVLANGKSVLRLKTLERRLALLKRGVGVSVLIVLAAGAIFYQVFRERQRLVEDRQRQAGASVAYGNGAMESGDLQGALKYFVDALRIDGDDGERGELHRLRVGSTMAQCPKLVRMWFSTGEVATVEFHPTEDEILAVDLLTPFARIYQGASDLPKTVMRHTNIVRSAVYSPDGEIVLTSGEGTTATLWQRDGTLIKRIPHSSRVMCAVFSPDGSRIMTGCDNGTAHVWYWKEEHPEPLTLSFHSNSVLCVAFSPDGTLMATGGRDGMTQVWNATNGARIGPGLRQAGWTKTAAFSPDNKLLATGSHNYARIFDLSTGIPRVVTPDLRHNDRVSSVHFSLDGRHLVTACLDHSACLWLLDRHQPPTSIAMLRHSGRVTSARFHPDGRRVLTGCADGTIRLWDLASSSVLPGAQQMSYSRDANRFLSQTNNSWVVRDVTSGRVVSPLMNLGEVLETQSLNWNGTFVLAGTSNQTTRSYEVWDVAAGKPAGARISVTNTAKAVLSDDGKCLLTLEDRSAQRWDVPGGTAMPGLLTNGASIHSACFSRDNRAIAIWTAATIRIFDAHQGRQRFEPLDHGYTISHVEFSPDATSLVSCQSDGSFNRCQARVWDAVNGKLKFALNHGDGVLFASFSPDGNRIVTAGEDFKAIVWNARTGEQIAILKHRDQVQSAWFSADSKLVVTASWDKTARIWHAETGETLVPPLRHYTELASARFTPDRRRVLIQEYFGLLRLWELPTVEHSLGDLGEFADLMSGAMEQPAVLRRDWFRLRDQFPQAFNASPKAVEMWHDFQGHQCVADRQFRAAEFHLEKARTMRPDDETLAKDLAQVRTRIQAGE